MRFISMGRLLHWKGFHLGLQSFAKANLPDAEYWILGIGPEQARLKRLAEQLKIAHQVKFWDRLPREESLQKLAQSHVLVHPSLHDSGGWVCIEAMATGRPVICLNLGGPGVQVTDETGIKVLAQTPEQAVQDLAQAMANVLGNASAIGQIYNVSGDRFVTFDGLARTCAAAVGKDPNALKIVHYDAKQFDFGKRKAFPMRTQHFFADIHKATQDLNWQPQFDLLSGLKDSFENDYLASKRDQATIDFSTDDEILGRQ